MISLVIVARFILIHLTVLSLISFVIRTRFILILSTVLGLISLVIVARFILILLTVLGLISLVIVARFILIHLAVLGLLFLFYTFFLSLLFIHLPIFPFVFSRFIVIVSRTTHHHGQCIVLRNKPRSLCDKHVQTAMVPESQCQLRDIMERDFTCIHVVFMQDEFEIWKCQTKLCPFLEKFAQCICHTQCGKQ